MTETKLCKDCRHCMPDKMVERFGFLLLRSKVVLDYRWPKCARAVKHPGPNYITGEIVPDELFYCSSERGFDLPNGCGPTAKFFEPI